MIRFLFCCSLVLISLEISASKSLINILTKLTETCQPHCTSRSCINTAYQILNNMNPEADPCDDFYEFSCGGFTKNKKIQDHEQSASSFNDLNRRLSEFIAMTLTDVLERPNGANESIHIQNAKNYYKSCLNEDYIEKHGEEDFKRFLEEELGGWPILNENYNVSKFIFYLKNYNQDRFNSYFDKDDFENQTLINEYSKYIKSFVLLLEPNLNSTTLDDDIESIIDLEKHYASLSEEKLGDFFRKIFKIESVKRTKKVNFFLSLEKNEPEYFDSDNELHEYFLETFITSTKEANSDVKEPNETTKPTEIFNLDRTFELEDFFMINMNGSQLDKVDDLREIVRSLCISAIWNLIKDHTKFLPKKYQYIDQKLKNSIYDTKGSLPRRILCVSEIAHKMPLVITRLYFKEYFSKTFPNSSLTKINDIFYRMQTQMLIKLKEISWMDEDSKNATLQKIESLKFIIAHQYLTENEDTLDLLYKNYKFGDERYLENDIIRYKAFNTTFSLFQTDYVDSPIDINAILDFERNSIIFSSGIINEPFYAYDRPNYLNYAGMGFILSHEIMHGFEFMDETFCVGKCWTDETIKTYSNISKCIKEQYETYKVPELNKFLNGSRVLKENIADNGAIDLSFKAYQNWVNDHGEEPLIPGLNFTQNQLFFINFAQTWCSQTRLSATRKHFYTDSHSPPKFRVVGPLANYPEFDEAFQCKQNLQKQKCSIW